MTTTTRNFTAEYLTASIAVNDRWAIAADLPPRIAARDQIARDAAQAGVQLDTGALNRQSLDLLSD